MVDFINKKSDKEFIDEESDKLSQLAALIDDEYVALEERDIPSTEKIGVYPNWQKLKIGIIQELAK